MPCDSGYSDYSSRVSYDEFNKLLKEHDKLTRAACEIVTYLRKKDAYFKDELSKKTLEWIDMHDRVDAARKKARAQREEKKALKKAAYLKLTAEERRALGLHR